MIEETLEELKEGIANAHDALKRELAKLRTGRANPDILDDVRVDYYGHPTPLNQLASISVPEARLMIVKPFEKQQIRQIEKSIMDAELGLTPQNDGEIIRLPIPQLTEERRKEIVKLARKAGEDCKVAIRKARHEAKDVLETLQKEGEASADDVERAKKELEDLVKQAGNQVDELVEKKEKDLLEV